MNDNMIKAMVAQNGQLHEGTLNRVIWKLSQYKERRERYRQCGWSESTLPENVFWYVDVSVKIDLLERLLAAPNEPIMFDEVVRGYQADDERRAWISVRWDNRLAVANAFHVIAQYLAGERQLMPTITPDYPPSSITGS
jgi:hypothetical protein